VSGDLTAIAIDAYANAASGYRGTIHFTNSDGSAQLPEDYTFRDYDNGIHTWRNGLTVFRRGNPTLMVADSVTTSIRGTVPLTVVSAAASQLVVTAPANVLAGVPFDITVSARDPYGNPATDYTGTVSFASSDDAAVLPDAYSFTPDDAGTHTFTGVALFTAGDQALLVTDADNGLFGSATITVDSGGGAAPRQSHWSPMDTLLALRGENLLPTFVELWRGASRVLPVAQSTLVYRAEAAAARTAPQPLDATPLDQFFSASSWRNSRAVVYKPSPGTGDDEWLNLVLDTNASFEPK
jgi:hypothetical protein